MGFNDFIKNDFIPECDGQVASGPASLPDPVALEAEENCISVYSLIMIVSSIVGEQIQPGSRRKRQQKQEEK